VVDEAWSVLQYPEGGAFLAGMARRARKYYLGLVTITQNAADLLGAAHGRAVVGNAATKLLLKQDSTTIDAVQDAFALSAAERRLLLSAGKGDGLLLARGRRVPLQIVASPAEHRLATTAPHETTTVPPEAAGGRGGSPARYPVPIRRRRPSPPGAGQTDTRQGEHAWP
jgi:DNA helicase HerA-like ATPase